MFILFCPQTFKMGTSCLFVCFFLKPFVDHHFWLIVLLHYISKHIHISNYISRSLDWVYTIQSYLSEKGLVHRDLAARNILVGHGKKLKIGDFGLMREMYHELYKVKKQRKLPIKWMAPEAIHEQIFTSKSDVYVLIDIYSTTV